LMGPLFEDCDDSLNFNSVSNGVSLVQRHPSR
jgi:hypothetical protein